MKLPVLAALILAAALAAGGFVARPGPVDLFVVAGQSNALGWMGDAAWYPADRDGQDARIPFYWVAPGFSSSNGAWTHLRPQDGRFAKGHFGPEVGLARRLLGAGYAPAIFKYARSVTSIAQHWKGPGDRAMYDDMVAELRKAIPLLEKKGTGVTMRALVWIQGESDAETGAMAAAYGKNLKTLIDDFRVNVARNPRLLVILGLDEQHPFVVRNPQVLAAQERLAATDRAITRTSMVGLEKADTTHLAPAALLEHGARIFEAYKRLAARQPAQTRLDIFQGGSREH